MMLYKICTRSKRLIRMNYCHVSTSWAKMFTGNSRKTRPPRSLARRPNGMRYRRRWEGDWSRKEEGRGSGNESRKVCRDPFEQRIEGERIVLEERTRRIHLLDPDSRRWSPAGIRGVPSSRLLLHFRPPAVFIHSLRRTPFRRLSFIITRPIIEAIIIEIYHAPRRERRIEISHWVSSHPGGRKLV